MKIFAVILSSMLIAATLGTTYPQSAQNLSEAQKFFQSGHKKLYESSFREAVKDFTKAIKLNPGNSVLEKLDSLEFRNEIAYALRALTKLQLKEYRSSLKDCEMAMKTDPKYSYAYYVRGLVNKAFSNFQGAIDDFSKTIELAPKNNWAYYDRGLVHQSLKDYKGAIADFTSAIEIANKMGEAYYQRALAKTELGDKDGAEQDMEMAAKFGVKEAKNLSRDIENVINSYMK
jgi:tetratricopeptide (TPR) repeat protein